MTILIFYVTNVIFVAPAIEVLQSSHKIKFFFVANNPDYYC